jgi:hypothetical protein
MALGHYFVDPSLQTRASVTITSSTTTATVSHTGHGFSNSDTVKIQGETGNPTDFNGNHVISNVLTDSYDFTIPDLSGASGTGTILASKLNNGEAGTVGDPYPDTQWALDTVTSGTDGDKINIKAGTSEIIAGAALDLTSWGTPSASKQITFRGYTAAEDDDGQGEIDGDALFAIFDSATLDYVSFVDLKMGNTGSNLIVQCDDWSSMVRCELHTTTNVNMVKFSAYAVIMGCYFHTWTFAGSNGIVIPCHVESRISKNFLDCGTVHTGGGAIACTGAALFVERNVIKLDHISAIGIKAASYSSHVIGNSIYNAAAGTQGGVKITATNNHQSTFTGNVIEGFSGAGGYAIRLTGGTATAPILVANNVYYGNTNDTFSSAGDPPIVEEDNIVATASPFTDPDNDDFTVTTEVKEVSFGQTVGGVSASTNKEDAGACQRLEASGGGTPASAHIG